MKVLFFTKEFIALKFLQDCQSLIKNEADNSLSEVSLSDKKSQFIYLHLLLNHLLLDRNLCSENVFKLGCPNANLTKVHALTEIRYEFKFSDLVNTIFYPYTPDMTDYDKNEMLKWRKRLYRLFDFLVDYKLITNLDRAYNRIKFNLSEKLVSMYAGIDSYNEFLTSSEEYQELINFSLSSEKLVRLLIIREGHNQILKLLSDKISDNIKNTYFANNSLDVIKQNTTQRVSRLFCLDLDQINLKNTLTEYFGITKKNVCAYLKRGLSTLLNLNKLIEYSDLLFKSFILSNRFSQYLNKTTNLIIKNITDKIKPSKIDNSTLHKKNSPPAPISIEEQIKQSKEAFAQAFGSQSVNSW